MSTNTAPWSPTPWKVEHSETWPFNIAILDADGNMIAEFRRVAFSSDQKTLADCRAAVGFKYDDRHSVIALIQQQEANVELMVVGANYATDVERIMKK
jgi:hypothetical protein